MNTIKTCFMFIFLAFQLFSCSKDKQHETEILKFPEAIPLESHSIAVPEVTYPSLLGVLDSILMVSDKFGDTLFHFYSIPTYEYVGSYGGRGSGPAEFLLPKYHNQFMKQDSQSSFLLSDTRSGKFLQVDMGDALASMKYEPKVISRLPPEAHIVYDLFQLDTNKLVGGSTSGLGRLFFYDINSKDLRWINNFPEVSYKIPQDQVGYLYYSSMGIKPDGSRVISALRMFDRIDVFDNFGNLLRSFSQSERMHKEPDLSDPEVSIPDDTDLYYMEVYCTDKYIYLKNYRMTHLEDYKGLKDNVTIDIMDWEFNPIKRYLLDKKIREFCVDERTQTIFGKTGDENNPIVTFQMK